LAYCTLSDVKQRANIPEADTSFDEKIQSKIEYAQEVIDLHLQGLTALPLSPVPDIIKEICADLACAFFLQEESPADERILVFERRGRDHLKEYVSALRLEARLKPEFRQLEAAEK